MGYFLDSMHRKFLGRIPSVIYKNRSLPFLFFFPRFFIFFLIILPSHIFFRFFFFSPPPTSSPNSNHPKPPRGILFWDSPITFLFQSFTKLPHISFLFSGPFFFIHLFFLKKYLCFLLNSFFLGGADGIHADGAGIGIQQAVSPQGADFMAFFRCFRNRLVNHQHFGIILPVPRCSFRRTRSCDARRPHTPGRCSKTGGSPVGRCRACAGRQTPCGHPYSGAAG